VADHTHVNSKADRREKVIGPELFQDMLIGGSRWLGDRRRIVDEMNVFPVPDGDTGTNMAMTMQKLEASLGGDFDGVDSLMKSAAHGALLGARGNSGVILSQIFKGFSDAVEGAKTLNPMLLGRALQGGSERAYQAVIKPVEGTILTVIKEAATAAALAAVEPGGSVAVVLDAALRQARQTLARTPKMLPKLREAGVVDSGGQGLVFILEGMSMVIHGDFVVDRTDRSKEKITEYRELDFQYCTEVIVTAEEKWAEDLRLRLQRDNDSLVVVSDGGIIKVHVHTNRPGQVITWAQEAGELLDVKIENMALQHTELAEPENDAEDPANLGVVAVSSGEGMKKIFESLGVCACVPGGQSMNPSTEQILEAVDKCPAGEVIILPNNKNILMSAERAAGFSKRPAVVVPTLNEPQGFAAMMEFEHNSRALECAEKMRKAINEIRVAEITTAVRDSQADGMEIKRGDLISIIDGRICFSDRDMIEIIDKTICEIAGGDFEVITFYAGEGQSAEKALEIAGKLSKSYPWIKFEAHSGGQLHYHYIISAE